MADSPRSFFSTLTSATSATASTVGEIYTVRVSGVDFVLSASMITRDSPNLFTQAFHGDFAESLTRTLVLDRDSEIFSLVCDYLRGYEILPLAPGAIPRRMTAETALINLTRDAEYLGLTQLHAKLQAPAATPPWFTFHAGLSHVIMGLEAVLAGALPDGIVWSPELGLVDGNSLPVMVYAKNMSVRLCYAQDVKINGRHPLDVPRSRSQIYGILSHPYSTQASATPDMYGAPHSDALFTLDEMPPVTLSELLSLHGHDHQTHAANFLSRLVGAAPEGRVWADVLWFTIPLRWEWAVDGSDRGRLDIRILSAKMKSRTYLISELDT